MKKLDIAVLLSFTAGFVDTASFLGLEGLFTAHVTGNFVTLGATLVYGTHGVLAKLLALPEFVLVVALTRLAGAALAAHRMPALRLLLAGEVAFLLAFFMLAAALGPFPNSDTPAALLTGFSGVAAMAMQNALHRVHLAGVPPSTIMTGNTTQAALDAIDLLRGAGPTAIIRGRFGRTLGGILCFAAGCASLPFSTVGLVFGVSRCRNAARTHWRCVPSRGGTPIRPSWPVRVTGNMEYLAGIARLNPA
jgi:uncharacterized membrane protein YoaK (UPF0700 family)